MNVYIKNKHGKTIFHNRKNIWRLETPTKRRKAPKTKFKRDLYDIFDHTLTVVIEYNSINEALLSYVKFSKKTRESLRIAPCIIVAVLKNMFFEFDAIFLEDHFLFNNEFSLKFLLTGSRETSTDMLLKKRKERK